MSRSPGEDCGAWDKGSWASALALLRYRVKGPSICRGQSWGQGGHLLQHFRTRKSSQPSLARSAPAAETSHRPVAVSAPAETGRTQKVGKASSPAVSLTHPALEETADGIPELPWMHFEK